MFPPVYKTEDAPVVDENRINTRQGHNEWPAFLRELLNDEVGTSA